MSTLPTDDAVESEMRAAATLASGRNQGARFEAGQDARLVAPGSASPGNESTVDATTRAALITVVTAAFFTLSVQGALTFQKYRFDKGLMLGTTMAAVNWCEDVARRKNCGVHGRFAAGSTRLGRWLASSHHALVTATMLTAPTSAF